MKVIRETGRFSMYVRIPFTPYYVSFDNKTKKLCITKRTFDGRIYRFRKILKRGGKGMKEEQAKTKWCPMSRTVDGDVVTNKDGGKVSDIDMCLTSKCMMWREYYGDDKVTILGFCGLAGKP